MYLKIELLGQGAESKELDELSFADEALCEQIFECVGACIEGLFECSEVDHFILLAADALETVQFRLTANQRNLTTFESEVLTFSRAGMLSFGTATTGGAAFSAVTTRNALGRLTGAGGWSERVQHKRPRCYLLAKESSRAFFHILTFGLSLLLEPIAKWCKSHELHVFNYYCIIIIHTKTSMFSHVLASLMVAFTLLPQTVEPLNSGQTDNVTRAEAATAMLLARNPNVTVIKNVGQFSDIQKGSWYEAYMLAAERFGIVKADADKHLRPNATVNRAEFLKMLSLTFNIPTGYRHSYKDVPADAWYSEYAGIVSTFHLPLQDDVLHLNPGKTVTQQQALSSVQIFLRLYNQPENSLFQEQQLAIDQSENKLNIYDIISTRQTNVVFIDKKPTADIPQPVVIPQSLPQLRTDIMSLVNFERLKAGLRPLTYNTRLQESAQRYAEQMSSKGFFGHVSPDGQTLRDRVAATGYYDTSFSADCGCVKGFTVGENLGRGQKTADEVMKDWMNSPTHRAAILDPNYNDVGVGVSAGIWVQHFGGVLLPGAKVAGTK